MVGGNLLSKQELKKALRELCNKDDSVLQYCLNLMNILRLMY